MRGTVRIGNASGYRGDDPEALARQVRGGPLDYVTLGPQALAETKELVRELTYAPRAEIGPRTAERIARLRASEEGQEGMSLFTRSSAPRWRRSPSRGTGAPSRSSAISPAWPTAPSASASRSPSRTRARTASGWRPSRRATVTGTGSRGRSTSSRASSTPSTACWSPGRPPPATSPTNGAGLSLFVVDTDRPGFTKQVQDTAINEPERQWTLFFDDVQVPKSALIGEEGKGHRYLFDLLNPERVVSAAIACGLGRYVLGKAVNYSRERSVFGAPIGTHQGLAHPMALAYAHLELA